MTRRGWSGIIAPLDTRTGDGRKFAAGSIRWDTDAFPLPLKFDPDEGDHSAMTVGQVDRVWIDGDVIRARGVLHTDTTDPTTTEAVSRVIELLEGDVAIGPSVELDDTSVEVRMTKERWDAAREAEAAFLDALESDEPFTPPEPDRSEDGDVIIDRWSTSDITEVIVDGRLRAVALVTTPAFAEARIELDAADVALAAAITAGLSAFANPQFGASGADDSRLVFQSARTPDETDGWGCPMTITDDGRIFGHATMRTRCHSGFADRCIPPPGHGVDDLAHFLVGDATGTGLPTGAITLHTTHGVNEDGTLKSHDHLANTGVAVADVTAGWDMHGLWFAGRLRPGVTDRELAELRGSAPSGEWHVIGGTQRLVGILAVNSPGFLVDRIPALAASAGPGVVLTAGATCCEDNQPYKSWESRMNALERMTSRIAKSMMKELA